MKKLVFGLIATVMFGFVGSAQVKSLTIDYSKGISIEDKMDLKDNHSVVTAKAYYEKLSGTLFVTGYSEKGITKIKSVMIEYNSDENYNKAVYSGYGGCPGGYRQCARGCNGNATELGVLLCIAYCIIDCSGN